MNSWLYVCLPLVLFIGCVGAREHRFQADFTPKRLSPSNIKGSDAEPIETNSVVPENENGGAMVIRNVVFQSSDREDSSNNLVDERGDRTATARETSTAEDADEGVTLELLVHLALEHNPSIQQAVAATTSAVGIRTQVGLRPNPSIGYFGEEIGNSGAGGLHGAFVERTFVRGGKLVLNRAVIGHDVQWRRWLAESQRLRVQNDIRIQFYEALGAQERLRLARRFRDVAQMGVEISKDLVRAKEGALPDVLQSEVQLSEVDLVIQRAEYDLAAAWNELLAVVGMPQLAQTTLLGELKTPTTDRDMEAAFAQLMAESPLIEAACAQVRRARANVRRQRAQAIPNWNAQVAAGHDDGTGDEFANIQLRLPLPVHNKNQGNIRAAYAEYRAATENVNRLKLQIRRSLARAMRDFQVSRASVRQYELSILPKVGETLQLMQKAQEAGEYDFLRVLTARRAYFDANLKYVIALTNLAMANARIDGLLLTGGLDPMTTYNPTDGLRGAALNGQ